jgi:hypothetical protein
MKKIVVPTDISRSDREKFQESILLRANGPIVVVRFD